MIDLISAADLSLLIGALVALLGLLGGGVAWLVRMAQAQRDAAVEQGRMLAQIEQLTAGTHEQVKNSHASNLRNDVDKAVDGTRRNEELLLGIVASLERLERTVAADREERLRADREMRTELDRVWVSGEREHRNLWQRIGDGLGVARPGEIDVPDEPY